MNIFRLKNKKSFPRGFTLVETLVTVGIFVAIMLVITLAQRDLFSFNSFIQADLSTQIEARRAVTGMVSEMREMSPSNLGSYAIATAATSSIMFYSDTNFDALKEQISYYIQGTKVMRSVVTPTGSPLVYNAGSAVVTTVISNILNGTSTPLFGYYDSSYTGTSSPLTIPVNISAIKLVKVTAVLGSTSSRGTTPLTVTSQVTLRNLKDNL